MKTYDNIALIIDMQNDFLFPDGALYIGHNTQQLRTLTIQFLNNFYQHTSSSQVIFTQDTHSTKDPELKMFGEHVIQGTWGHEICAAIKNATHSALILKKHTFFNTSLANKILQRSHANTHYYFMGVLAHICVSDALTYLYNEFVLKFHTLPNISLIQDCIDDTNTDFFKYFLQRAIAIYGTSLHQSDMIFKS